MKDLLLLCSIALFFSCSKPEPVPANELVGVWRLSTYCKPVSASGCTAVTVLANKGVFVYFGNDGEFNETYENSKPIEYGFLGCGSGNYVLEGNRIRIRALCMSSSEGQLMDIVSISDSQFVLNPFGSGEYVFIRN